MLFRKPGPSPDIFWREYEEKIGEKITAYSLGKYLSGWEEFEQLNMTRIWGLIIVSAGGLRFHHFPQHYWFEAFSSYDKNAALREKTFFIPKTQIIRARLMKESSWWKKIFLPSVPKLEIHFRDNPGNERRLLLEIDFKPGGIIESLNTDTAS